MFGGPRGVDAVSGREGSNTGRARGKSAGAASAPTRSGEVFVMRATGVGEAAVIVGLQGGTCTDARRGIRGVPWEALRQQAIGIRPAIRQGMADGGAGVSVTICAAWAQRQTEACGRPVPRSGNSRHQTRSCKRRRLSMTHPLYPMRLRKVIPLPAR